MRVKWINDLKDAAGKFLPHLLTVDPTLHWANPPGGYAGRDSRPAFTSRLPAAVHRPGAHGHPRARRRRRRRRERRLRGGLVSAGRQRHPGRLRPQGHAGSSSSGGRLTTGYGALWGPGFATFQYPNENRASTIWYHDHALGMTRLNVYAGPAGLLHRPRRPCRRRRGEGHAHRDDRRAAGTGAQGERQVPAQQDLLRDPHRDPGPLLQRRRVALLPGLARVLRRRRRSLHP